MEDYHRGIFIHLLFVEPCTPFLTFPPCHPYYIPPPPHSYSLCGSYIYSRSPPYLFLLPVFLIPPTTFSFFCILDFTLVQVTFMRICNIIMILFFSYFSH